MTHPSNARSGGRAGAVALLCVALLLGTSAGCSTDNPAPEPLTDDPTSAAASPSPTEAGPPPLPPEAKGTSKRAAIAFVEHVIDVLNYSSTHLDTRAFEALAADGCAACTAIVEGTRDIRVAGGDIRGGAWTPIETHLLAGGPGRFQQVQSVVECARQIVERSKGATPITHPPGRTVYVFDLVRAGRSWKLGGIRGGSSR